MAKNIFFIENKIKLLFLVVDSWYKHKLTRLGEVWGVCHNFYLFFLDVF
jgi:hypothetical protein